MSHFEPIESNQLMQAIAIALSANPAADGVHVSIEPHGREGKDRSGSATYVKALCWNLVVKAQDLSDDEPELVVVDEEVNEDTLRADLEAMFPAIECVVDNDILIEEDE
jgi:hypothetical protein